MKKKKKQKIVVYLLLQINKGLEGKDQLMRRGGAALSSILLPMKLPLRSSNQLIRAIQVKFCQTLIYILR